ncbi:MAG: hypothetical protein ACI8RZ_002132 [Myxococcota bacterium]|jgi:hypothetical protein
MSIGPTWSAALGFHTIGEVNQPSVILEWGSEWLQGRIGGIVSAELLGQEVYTGGPLTGVSIDWTDMVVSFTERWRTSGLLCPTKPLAQRRLRLESIGLELLHSGVGGGRTWH